MQYGGWISPYHTAQEGELVALLNAVGLAKQHSANPVIYSDSQHLVHSIQRKRSGKRFTPHLLTLLIKSLGDTSIDVQHISAHTRDPCINAGNPYADNLAKIGASEAFGPLTLDQLPHNLLPPEERFWKAHSQLRSWADNSAFRTTWNVQTNSCPNLDKETETQAPGGPQAPQGAVKPHQ